MNPTRPAVSIVVPVHNRAGLIGRAVQSVLDQPSDAEVIVVDDGSTEDVRGALESRFGHSPRLRYLRQEIQGACVARNFGLARASGEFVKFLDSDDELLPGVLAEEVRAARENGCDALLTSREERMYREDGTEDASKRRYRPVPDLSHGIDDMLEGKAPWTSAVLYRTEFVRPLRWDSAWTKAQDWGWSLTVCLAGARFHSLDMASCIYNHHAGVRITNYGDLMIRSTRGRQLLLPMVERELMAQGGLTEGRKRKLAQYYYRDCQVLAEYDPLEWRRIWTHCEELCPGFRPVESNRMVRLLTRCLGVHAGIRVYVLLKKAIPRKRKD